MEEGDVEMLRVQWEEQQQHPAQGVLGRRVSSIATSATTVMLSKPTTACMELPLPGMRAGTC